MAAITLRSTKGIPLTMTEVDDNFTNINTELGAKLSNTGGTISVASGNAAQLSFLQTSQRQYRLGLKASDNKFYISDVDGSADRLVINTSGNVGIGTSSPSSRLHVATVLDSSNIINWYDFSDAYGVFSTGDGGSANGYLKLQTGVYNNASTNNIDMIVQNKDNNFDAGFRITAGSGGGSAINNGYLAFSKFSTNGTTIVPTERMRIDANGNIGVGLTPSAWGTANNVRALQLNSGSFWTSGTSDIYVGQNYHFNGTNKIYSTTGAVTEYQQSSGAHAWYTAPSGTAGGTVTLTARMSLSNSGNLNIDGLTASSAVATDSSKNLVSVTNTGSGNNVLATSPTLVTPVLGTPTSGNFSTGTFTWPTFNQNTTGTAANVTGTVAVLNGGTGVTTSTGSGSVVLSTSPTLVTPVLGTPQSGSLGSCADLPIVAGTTGTLSVARGGTGQISRVAAFANLHTYATTVTSAGVSTLTDISEYYQYFTGTSTHTVRMPVVSGLSLGWTYHIVNNSTGTVLVQSSAGAANDIGTVLPGSTMHITCISTSGTGIGSWDYGFSSFNTLTGTGSNVLNTTPLISNLITTNTNYIYQPTPTAVTATTTLTIAQLLTGIITSTSATAVSLTLPTGTLTDGGILGGLLPINQAFEWSLINLGSSAGAVTILVGATHTIVGSATVSISASARFRTTKTDVNTFVTYRVD
jgi:hypothetical protein